MAKTYRGRKKTYRKKKTIKRKLKKYNSKKLSSLAAKVGRFHDYPLVANSLKSGGIPAGAVVAALENGNVLVRHKEFIRTIDPTTAFTVQVELPLNPGMRQSFPWLSGIAKNFEQYDWKGLCFEFVSTSSDSVLGGSATTSLGSVNMATQYNVLSPAFTTQKEMLNYDFANAAKPSQSFIHPVDCKNGSGPLDRLWIRDEETSLTGADRRLYDAGDFSIATEGCQGTPALGSIGQLWVTFEVELSKAKLDNKEGRGDHFYSSTYTNAAMFGVPANIDPANTLHGEINDAGDTYEFPNYVNEGTFLISWRCDTFNTGTQVTVTYPTAVATNCTILGLWHSDTGLDVIGASPQPGATACYAAGFQYMVKVNDEGATFRLHSGVLPYNARGMDLFITQCPNYQIP